MRKIPLLFVLLVFGLSMQLATPRKIFLTSPKAVAEYLISSFYNNQIGEPMMITLRITTEPTVTLDLSKLPKVGEKWVLPGKVIVPVTPPSESVPLTRVFREHDNPPLYDEGYLEVRSRRISQFYKEGRSVTEVLYEFQYLNPIDFQAFFDDKILTKYIGVSQVYTIYYPGKERLAYRSETIQFKEAVFYLSGQVDESSQPIMTLFEATEKRSAWYYLRILGFVLSGSALLMILGTGIRIFISAGRKPEHTGEIRNPLTTLQELYTAWEKSLYYGTFIEAIKYYRLLGTERHFLWWKSTMILYSGVVLEPKQIATIFKEMLKELRDDNPL